MSGLVCGAMVRMSRAAAGRAVPGAVPGARVAIRQDSCCREHHHEGHGFSYHTPAADGWFAVHCDSRSNTTPGGNYHERCEDPVRRDGGAHEYGCTCRPATSAASPGGPMASRRTAT